MSIRNFLKQKNHFIIISGIILSIGFVYYSCLALPGKEGDKPIDKAIKEVHKAELDIESGCSSTKSDGKPDDPQLCGKAWAAFDAAEEKYQKAGGDGF